MTAGVVIDGNWVARVWLFDFDNTLAALESQVDWVASRRVLEDFLRSAGVGDAIFRAFPARNLPLYNALLLRLLESRARDSPVLAAGTDTAALVRSASDIIERYELRGVARAAELPGTTELLGGLDARDCPVAIVTSNSSRTVTRWLELHGLTRQVDVIVGRDSLLPLKPAPDMVLRALELCCGTASEAVLVGDSEADLQAAHAAKVEFLGIAGSVDARSRQEALGARRIWSSPAELALSLGLAEARAPASVTVNTPR